MKEIENFVLFIGILEFGKRIPDKKTIREEERGKVHPDHHAGGILWYRARMGRYNKDKEQLKRIMEKNREAYSNLDSDMAEMLKVMTGVELSEEYIVTDDGKEKRHKSAAKAKSIAEFETNMYK